jgi:hypothetical protein
MREGGMLGLFPLPACGERVASRNAASRVRGTLGKKKEECPSPAMPSLRSGMATSPRYAGRGEGRAHA